LRKPIALHRHLVTFEAPGASVPDGDGGYTEGWAPLSPATAYVTIQAATVRDLERATSGTITTTATHIVHGYFHPGVTTETRITDANGKVYQVAGVDNVDQKGEEMELFVEERL
jgi:head-tail adaptor